MNLKRDFMREFSNLKERSPENGDARRYFSAKVAGQFLGAAFLIRVNEEMVMGDAI